MICKRFNKGKSLPPQLQSANESAVEVYNDIDLLTASLTSVESELAKLEGNTTHEIDAALSQIDELLNQATASRAGFEARVNSVNAQTSECVVCSV